MVTVFRAPGGVIRTLPCQDECLIGRLVLYGAISIFECPNTKPEIYHRFVESEIKLGKKT